MTAMQNAMLQKIAESEFSHINGLIPTALEEIGSIWAIEVIETPEDKGTFTSLLNEGMVYHHTDINPKDNVVGLTEKGFEAYRKSIQP